MYRSDIYKIAAGAIFSVAIILAQQIQIEKQTTVLSEQMAKKIDNANKTSQSSSNDGLIELATNSRMSSIVAYQLTQQDSSINQLQKSGYLNALAQELRQDYIDDNIYARLNKLSANTSFEYKDLGSGIKLIRDKWSSSIAIGSHFDKSPSASLLIAGEAIPEPICTEGTRPYVAYALAVNSRTKQLEGSDVKIVTETVPSTQYRFEIHTQDGNITTAIDSLQYRILVDIGCTKDQKEDFSDITNQQ